MTSTPLDYIIAREAHWSQKHFYQFIKGYNKGYICIADEEIQKSRSSEKQMYRRAGASTSEELGCVSLPVWICSPTWKLFKPHTLGMFMESSSHRQDQWLMPSPSLLASWENGGGAEHFKLWIMAWSFQSPHPGAIWEPTQSCLMRTKDSHHPGDDKDFRTPVSGIRFKDRIYRTDAFFFLIV